MRVTVPMRDWLKLSRFRTGSAQGKVSLDNSPDLNVVTLDSAQYKQQIMSNKTFEK